VASHQYQVGPTALLLRANDDRMIGGYIQHWWCAKTSRCERHWELAKERGIYQVFHLFNNFDIPVGLAREVHDGVIYSDYTMLTTVRDSQNPKFYYRTYEDLTIKMVDLDKLDKDARKIRRLTTESKQTFIDVSKKLK
jgi:penicillin V acylase-like amidase (Ntn superfamily)